MGFPGVVCLHQGGALLTLSFITANYVARAVGYRLSPFRWAEAEQATVERFSLADWDAILDAIQAAGFRAVEVWRAHAHPDMPGDARAVARVRAALERRGLLVVGYACGLGDAERQPDLTERYFATARALGAPLIVGGFDAGAAPLLARWARQYGVKVALENHPEKTPEEVLEKIRAFPDVLGAAVDTGWFATQGFPPAEAIRRLAPHLLHVHLKDVRAVGAHDTCVLGEGVANIPEVVTTLKDIGYEGAASIEHEPPDHDPMPDVEASLRFLASFGLRP
jgi:L-ribulose-5-phosphate 3-epimerase